MPKVVNYFEMHHKYCQRDDCVACAFKNFTEDYWNDPTDNKVYKALSLLQTNMANSRKFRNVQWTWSRQNDSMEFLLTLLKTLRGKVHPTARPIMKELFSFQMAESLYCPNRSCKAVSSQNSIHNSLTIDLNNPRPLKDMIHAYFARDTRPGWRCSHCNQYVGAQDRVQGVRMHTSPNILVIDLKRFTPIGHTGHMIKNNAHIPLKQELDLTPYTVNNHPSRYQLQSVVHHAGSLTGGHYIAVCKGPGDDWRQLNDQTVTVTDARSAMNRKDGFTPYILFYVRRGGRACASLLDDVNIHLV
jgi:ubiquitin C-terminal hydrolase